MYRLLFILLANILTLTSVSQSGQPLSQLQKAEDSLKVLGKEILYGISDTVKMEASQIFTKMLKEALDSDPQRDYPFDSLQTIAKIIPDDKSFRLFNWNMPFDNGTFRFFGLLQYEYEGKNMVVELTDSSSTLSLPEKSIVSAENWFGALYYQVIAKTENNNTLYTLLGWDGNHPLTNRKVIEILTFEDGKPEFGKKIFPDFSDGNNARILFEYSKQASLSLKFEEQTYWIKKQQGKKVVNKSYEEEMIVFDHLTPMDPSLEGQFRFYVPSGDVYDAFRYKDGNWLFMEDIDAKNAIHERDLIDQHPTELELTPSEK